jgi:hypothetical protein
MTEVNMDKAHKVETTLGELIIALTDEAAPRVRSKRELYGLVSVLLSDLLTISEGNWQGVEIRRWLNQAA